eukprot:CAMPEP_0177645988 /NCGR_PEP_ID=MMETSP0447-20121125/9538_1 /TAXON_ID=0 /ORGANISM="Stygamoeba regulata, Strain BSH-02190019" /LENGTH=405 /DNA_ID=CAMNT_0019148499 /DNA_START=531 /DNA_END=1748 /DNA_ORIENTATION=+
MKLLQLIDLRYGLFMGSFGGVFQTVELLLKKLEWKETRKSLIAGALAGLSLLCLKKEDRPSIMLYALVRSGESFVAALDMQNRFPAAISKFQHYDTLLMCLTAGQILYTYVHKPATLNSTYYNFLLKFGAKDVRAIKVVADKYNGQPPDVGLITELCSDRGIPLDHCLRDGGQRVNICRVIHPHQTCERHALSFSTSGFVRSLFLYAPLQTVIVAVFVVLRWRGGRHLNPLQMAGKTLLAICRSAAFLSLYCTIAWYVGVCSRGIIPALTPHINRLSLCLAGLSVLLEMKSRRMELALYCLPRALESAFNELHEVGLVRTVRHGELGLFCLAAALLTYCHQMYPESFKPSIRGMLQFFWGQPKTALLPAPRKVSLTTAAVRDNRSRISEEERATLPKATSFSHFF